MAVVVFAEGLDKKIKKSSLEAISCGAILADKLGVECITVALGEYDAIELQALGKSGAKKVIHVSSGVGVYPSAMVYANILSACAKEQNASVVLLSKSSLVDGIASRLSVELNYNTFASFFNKLNN